jgi:hypothetical protein
MQLSPVLNTLEVGNVLASGEFGVAKNAKMFKILSDSMYKDKAGSMIRELCSNARDAHVANGTPDLPFIVHLPSAFEPWFSVTDFGTGISPEDIFKVLTVYGESTKDQSNDEIGAFGLGAKTPFAYTDNFTVQSCYNGMLRMYTASTGESGMPTLSMQVEQPTSEPNGFMVMVTVNEGDFDRFKSKTITQLRFFPTKPAITNCNDFQWKDLTIDVAYSSEFITMYDGGQNNVRGLWLTQGGVGYPVDISELADISQEMRDFAYAIENNNAILHFNIGEIDVTAPREAVSYDKRTIQNIIDRITLVGSAMCREAVAEIQKEPSIWNRAVLYNNHIAVIKKAIKQSRLFSTLFDGMDTNYADNLSISVTDLLTAGFVATNLSKQNSYRSNSVPKMKRTVLVNRSGYSSYSSHSNDFLVPMKEVHVYLRDTNSKPMARVKHFIFENNFPLTLLIEDKDTNDVILADKRKAVADALRMPIENVKLLSDLEAPKTPTSTNGSTYTTPKSYIWTQREDATCSRNWKKLYNGLDDQGVAVWVEMDRHDLIRGDDFTMVATALKAGELGYDLISVNGQTAKRIRDGKVGVDLISVSDAAIELKARLKQNKSMFVKHARDTAFLEVVTHNSIICTLIDNGMFPELGKQLVNMKDKRSSVGKILGTLTWMRFHVQGMSDAADKGEKRGKEVINVMLSGYPMLKYIMSTNRYGDLLQGDELNDVLAYIVERNKVVVDTAA